MRADLCHFQHRFGSVRLLPFQLRVSSSLLTTRVPRVDRVPSRSGLLPNTDLHRSSETSLRLRCGSRARSSCVAFRSATFAVRAAGQRPTPGSRSLIGTLLEVNDDHDARLSQRPGFFLRAANRSRRTAVYERSSPTPNDRIVVVIGKWSLYPARNSGLNS